jgi:sarcosine oxidase
MDVALIGPGEPADPPSHDGPFASHYDSGRITRHLDASPVWAELAARSIAQYPTIATASSIEFHRPVGLLWADRGPGGLTDLAPSAAKYGVPLVPVAPEAAAADLHWCFASGHAMGFEAAPAGYIDPRRMVEAQLVAAESAGASVQATVVEQLEPGEGTVTIHMRSGKSVTANQVVVAAGAYTGFLLRNIAHVPIVPITAAVILGELTAEDAAALDGMPAMIHRVGDDDYVDVYAVPPVQYPDGRWYLKLGAEVLPEIELRSEAAVREWMTGGADEWATRLDDSLRALLPDLRFVSTAVKRCMYARTPSRFPYVDHVADRIIVAAGGNGRAAKSADAIGSLAVDLARTGSWNDPLDQELFCVPQ